jgi:MFS family permease
MLEALINVLVILSTPTIIRSFHASIGSSSVLLTAFFVPFVVLMPAAAKLAIIFGRKRVFLIGLVFYVVGSIIAFLSATYWMLILGRVIQGLGGSAFEPISVAIVGDLIPTARQGRAMGILGTAGSIAASVSLVGGLLINSFGWRSIFIVSLLFGIVSIILVNRYLPTFPRGGTIGAIDWGGGITLTLSMVLLIIGISYINSWGWASVQSLVFFGGSLACLLVNKLLQRKIKEPFIDYRLFSTQHLWLSSIAAAASVFALTGATLILPLYLDTVLQVDASVIGVTIFLNGTGLFFGALIGGLVADRWSNQWPGVISLSLVTATIFMMGLLTPVGIPYIVVAFVVLGLAVGTCIAPFTTVITRLFSARELGEASGAFNLIRRTGTITGAALAVAVLEYRLSIWSPVLNQDAAVVTAYRDAFWFLGLVSCLAILPASRLNVGDNRVTAKQAVSSVVKNH